MSSTAAKAAPKSFQQVKNVTQWVFATLGGYAGYSEKSRNDKLWWEHHRARWAKNAEEEAAKKPKASGDIPEIVPEGLHGLYKEVAGAAAH